MAETSTTNLSPGGKPWQLYQNGGKGGRSISGSYVAISPGGAISISGALSKDIPGKRRWMMIQYDLERYLLLTPVESPLDGSLKIMLPGGRRGVQARIGSQSGTKGWGIRPKEVTRYAARWEGDSLLVDLFSQFDGSAEDGPAEAPTVQSVPHEVAQGGSESPPPAAAPVDIPGQRRVCETCLHRGPRTELCRNRPSPRYQYHVGAAESCSFHVHRHPPDEPKGEKPDLAATAKHGKHPMGICPGCRRSVQVTGKGVYPHDASGVLYVAGHGDPDQRCPGSNERPMEA